jgi:hypothetical protein
MVDTDNLTPFSMKLRKFVVSFETGTVQRGAARSFDATVDLTIDHRPSLELVVLSDAVGKTLTLHNDRSSLEPP